MSDLRGNSIPETVKTSSGAKIIAAVVVILGVGAAAAYAYETGQFNSAPKSVVTNSELPGTPSGSAQ